MIPSEKRLVSTPFIGVRSTISSVVSLLLSPNARTQLWSPPLLLLDAKFLSRRSQFPSLLSMVFQTSPSCGHLHFFSWMRSFYHGEASSRHFCQWCFRHPRAVVTSTSSPGCEVSITEKPVP